MARDSTRKLFEMWKEFADALHILQRKLRHIDMKLAERVRVYTSEREQKHPRNAYLTRRRECI